MARFTNIVTALIVFLCSAGSCNLADGWKSADEEADSQLERFAARHPAVFARDNLHEALLSAPNNSIKASSFLGERSLDGPALLASWLGIRQLTCDDPNYFVCANNPSKCCPEGDGCCPPGTVSECCPTGTNCCVDSHYCVEPGGNCCGTSGTCDADVPNCCEGIACYPNGAECCSNGHYCPSGSVCVLYQGAVKCSSTGVGPPPPTITPPTPITTTPPVVDFEYYYYTITWWYIEWFYIWTVHVNVATTVLTSSTTTLYTTISIYDTNSAAAASSFSDLSQTLSLPTPAQRTNPVPVGTSPAVPSPTRSSLPSSTSSSRSAIRSQTETGSSSSATTTLSGQKSSANATRAWSSFWTAGALVGFLIVWIL